MRALQLPPVTGSDIAAIGAMWGRCSLATRIARFHAPVRDIPASYLTTVLVDPAANVVEDAWQRRGIGRRLTAHLISAAPARGITTLTAAVLTANAPVADLLRQVPASSPSPPTARS